MQARFKRFTALILSVLMVLTSMPMGAMAEETVIPTEDISVEVIPDDSDALPDQETAPVEEEMPDQELSEETSIPEVTQEEQMPQEEVPLEETIPQAEETQPAEDSV